MSIRSLSSGPSPSKLNSAFTLIELLVVIAIIGLLSAILFPVFSRARENARRSSCSSNEKQMAMGLIQYSSDFDERLPHFQGWYGGEGEYAWYKVIQPYVKSYEVIRCPSVHTYKGGSFPTNSYSTSYCMPGLGNTLAKRVVWDNDGLKLSEAKEPARTFMVMESAYRGVGDDLFVNGGYGYPYYRLDNVTSTTPEEGVSSHYMAYENHLDGYNVAFLDGHVKWLRKGLSKDYIWDLNRAP